MKRLQRNKASGMVSVVGGGRPVTDHGLDRTEEILLLLRILVAHPCEPLKKLHGPFVRLLNAHFVRRRLLTQTQCVRCENWMTGFCNNNMVNICYGWMPSKPSLLQGQYTFIMCNIICVGVHLCVFRCMLYTYPVL